MEIDTNTDTVSSNKAEGDVTRTMLEGKGALAEISKGGSMDDLDLTPVKDALDAIEVEVVQNNRSVPIKRIFRFDLSPAKDMLFGNSSTEDKLIGTAQYGCTFQRLLCTEDGSIEKNN